WSMRPAFWKSSPTGDVPFESGPSGPLSAWRAIRMRAAVAGGGGAVVAGADAVPLERDGVGEGEAVGAGLAGAIDATLDEEGLGEALGPFDGAVEGAGEQAATSARQIAATK